MYMTKIATLIYKIFHRITPSSLERLIIQRGQNKYDLWGRLVSYHHRVSVPCFEAVLALILTVFE